MLKKLNQFTVAMQKINKVKMIKKLHIWTTILVFTLPLSFSLSFVGKKKNYFVIFVANTICPSYLLRISFGSLCIFANRSRSRSWTQQSCQLHTCTHRRHAGNGHFSRRFEFKAEYRPINLDFFNFRSKHISTCLQFLTI